MQLLRHGIATAAAAAMAGVLAGAAWAQDAPGVTEDQIKVGSFGPLTGPVYIYGKLSMNGVEVYFDKINEEGGVHGRELTLVREDDLCKPEGAIAAVKKLAYEHEVFAIVGGACSNSTLAARPEIERSGVPFHIFAAVDDNITDPPAPNIYTTQLTASIESRAQLQWALDHGAERIAIVAQHDAWGRSRYEAMLAAFEEAGIEPVADEEMTIDQNDGTAQALRLQGANADAVLAVVYPKPAAVLIRDSIKIGYAPAWIGQTAIQDLPALQSQINLDGALDDFVSITTVPGHPEHDQYAEWRERLKAKFPNDELSVFNLMGIAAAEVFVEVLEMTGPELTRESFLANYENIVDFESSVYPGPISCANTHQCNQSPAFVALEDGAVAYAGTVALQ